MSEYKECLEKMVESFLANINTEPSESPRHENDEEEASTAKSNEQRGKKDENELKKAYYSSNPLRCYGTLRGDQTLPKLSKKQQQSQVLSENADKQLPKIITELRETSDFVNNRSVYKRRLKSELNLASNCCDETEQAGLSKNQSDVIENVKKIYNEMSRLNIRKPFDVENVESVLKKTIFSNSSKCK